MLDFEKVNGVLGTMSPGLLFWIIGATFALVLAVIFAIVWQRIVSGKVRRTGPVVGMHFGDVEAMRKSGMINEDEYRTLKRKVAERALADSRGRDTVDADARILMEASADPDAVRKLLPADQKQRPAATKPPTPGRPVQAPPIPKPAQTVPVPPPPAPPRAVPEELLGDPLAEIPPAPPKPSMNMPRVVAEKERTANEAAAGAQSKGELDLLLEKGAITPDQYQKLKSFFTKPEA